MQKPQMFLLSKPTSKSFPLKYFNKVTLHVSFTNSFYVLSLELVAKWNDSLKKIARQGKTFLCANYARSSLNREASQKFCAFAYSRIREARRKSYSMVKVKHRK